jgi:predicted small secreted protein
VKETGTFGREFPFPTPQTGVIAMNLILRLSAALIVVLGLSACNTVEGAGQDIERAGEEIEDAGN